MNLVAMISYHLGSCYYCYFGGLQPVETENLQLEDFMSIKDGVEITHHRAPCLDLCLLSVQILQALPQLQFLGVFTYLILMISYCAVLYCTVLYCTVLRCSLVYCTECFISQHYVPKDFQILCCIVMYVIVVYCIIVFGIVLYCIYSVCDCTVQYYNKQYCIVLYDSGLFYIILHDSELYCIVL